MDLCKPIAYADVVILNVVKSIFVRDQTKGGMMTYQSIRLQLLPSLASWL